MPRGRKYKATNALHNISAENKMHNISNSIDQSSLLIHDRPHSEIDSLRYSKSVKKNKKFL